jgi:hypothetical protein
MRLLAGGAPTVIAQRHVMRYRERLAVEKVDQKSWIDGLTDFGGRVDPPFMRNIRLGGWSIPVIFTTKHI